MTSENGCVALTTQNITDGTVVVTPAATPVYGEARVTRVGRTRGVAKKLNKPAAVRLIPLAAAPDGDDLVVTLQPGLRPGDKVCWTAYA